MAKEIPSIVLSILFLLSGYLSPASAGTIMTHQKRIVLDPGHCGKDKPPHTPSRPQAAQAAQIALELARMVAAELADTFYVKLTCPSDTTQTPQSPADRSGLANQTRADLFISIHPHNAGPKNALIFYYGIPGTSQKTQSDQWDSSPLANAAYSREIAETTARQLRTDLNLQTRIYQAPLIPMEGLSMPGILIEPFALSKAPAAPGNRQDFLTPYATSIARAIRTYLNSTNR